MAKLGTTPAKKKTASAVHKEERVYDDAITLSSELSHSQLVALVHGAMTAGKTFLAGTASAFWPEKLPAAKPVVLEDMLWFAADAGATDGFRPHKIEVPIFDLVRFMSDESVWRRYSFAAPPSVIQASEKFAKLAEDRVRGGVTKTIVVDTLTTLDVHMMAYHDKLYGASSNQYEPYKKNLFAHRLFHHNLKLVGANIIYLCHTRATNDETKQEKDKNASVLVAGGARFVPDLTGQAPKIYKHDASLQLAIRATRAPGKKLLDRVVYTVQDPSKGDEIKNRYEGVLNEQEPPHLGKIFAKIRAAC